MKMVRKPDYDIEDVILNRWSPRAMSGEPVSRTELMRLFEAARWAPSAYNNQPWRFIYGFKGTKHWDVLFRLLVEFNRSWCREASVLVLTLSKDTFRFDGKFSITHSFDTGAAWQNIALQGSSMGLVVHGMQGFDYDAARKVLDIPDGYTVEMMFAVGRPGRKSDLDPALQEREVVSDREKVSSFAVEGHMIEEKSVKKKV